MSAAKVLRYGLVVRNPETLLGVALPAGTEVPDWATDLVHDDDLEVVESAPKAEKKAKGKGSKKAKSEAEDGDGDDTGAGHGAGDPSDADTGYSKLTNAALAKLIAERNEGRAEESLVVPESGTKANLVAALEADDQAQA